MCHHLREPSTSWMTIFPIFQDFGSKTRKCMCDFKWNCWNYRKQAWMGCRYSELKLNMISWNVTNWFRGWIFMWMNIHWTTLVNISLFIGTLLRAPSERLQKFKTVALKSLYLQKWKQSTTLQTHFGFFNFGSKMHHFNDTSFLFCNSNRTPCKSAFLWCHFPPELCNFYTLEMGAISKSWWFIGLYMSTDDALAVSNSFERILWRFRFCKAHSGMFHWCSLLGINELRIAPQRNWKEKNLKSFITSSGIKNDIYQERPLKGRRGGETEQYLIHVQNRFHLEKIHI